MPFEVHKRIPKEYLERTMIGVPKLSKQWSVKHHPPGAQAGCSALFLLHIGECFISHYQDMHVD